MKNKLNATMAVLVLAGILCQPTFAQTGSGRVQKYNVKKTPPPPPPPPPQEVKVAPPPPPPVQEKLAPPPPPPPPPAKPAGISKKKADKAY